MGNVWLIAAAGVLLLPLWVAVMAKWQIGYYGLLAYIPFAGIISAQLHLDVVGVLAKDALFVLPLYIGVFVFHIRALSGIKVPTSVAILMSLLFLLVLVQMINPGTYNLLSTLIGFRVWFFYAPLALITMVVVSRYDGLLRLYRVMAVFALVPCAVGLLQWFLSKAIGYDRAITLFLGDLAYAATQGFGQRDLGGVSMRIPATFFYAEQYFAFTIVMLVPTYAVFRGDPDVRWRRLGLLSFLVVIAAAMLTGVQAAYLFCPMAVVLMVMFEGRTLNTAFWLLSLPVLFVVATSLGGLDPLVVLEKTLVRIDAYGEHHVLDRVIDAMRDTPFGDGVGTGTSAARHAVGHRVSVENYYARTVRELGVPGLVLQVWLFGAMIWWGFHGLRATGQSLLRPFAAANLAVLIVLPIQSFKGPVLETDPVIVYFWILVGITLQLPQLAAAMGAPRAPAPPPPQGFHPGPYGPGPGRPAPGGPQPRPAARPTPGYRA